MRESTRSSWPIRITSGPPGWWTARGWQTGPEPLVLILHLGYAWLPAGLVLLGLTIIADLHVAALHALTAGVIGTMTLAIMTRASLGHTGRPLNADRVTALIYAAVVTGALLRVISPLLPGYQLMLWLSGAADVG